MSARTKVNQLDYVKRRTKKKKIESIVKMRKYHLICHANQSRVRLFAKTKNDYIRFLL